MSIQTEIARISGAKQSLADWLLDHDVEVSFNAKLDELVELLDDVPTGGDTGVLVPVDSVRSASTVSFAKVVTPPGSSDSTETIPNGTRYFVPAKSLMVVYAFAGTGGSSKQQATVTATGTSDIQTDTVYQVASTSLAVKPVLVCAVSVGETGGTVTFTKRTSSGEIM